MAETITAEFQTKYAQAIMVLIAEQYATRIVVFVHQEVGQSAAMLLWKRLSNVIMVLIMAIALAAVVLAAL